MGSNLNIIRISVLSFLVERDRKENRAVLYVYRQCESTK